jgi:hypothetical protein
MLIARVLREEFEQPYQPILIAWSRGVRRQIPLLILLDHVICGVLIFSSGLRRNYHFVGVFLAFLGNNRLLLGNFLLDDFICNFPGIISYEKDVTLSDNVNAESAEYKHTFVDMHIITSLPG